MQQQCARHLHFILKFILPRSSSLIFRTPQPAVLSSFEVIAGLLVCLLVKLFLWLTELSVLYAYAIFYASREVLVLVNTLSCFPQCFNHSVETTSVLTFIASHSG